jgi:hypothetical protein
MEKKMADLHDQEKLPFSNLPQKSFSKYRPWDLEPLNDAVNNNINRSIKKENIVKSDSIYKEKPLNSDDLKAVLQEKKDQQQKIIERISDKSNSPLSLGGFFEPSNMRIPNSARTGQEINRLMDDMYKNRELIEGLANNLMLAEAKEKMEQAELFRRTAEQAKESAEQRLQTAMKQINSAVSQLDVAITKAKHAEQSKLEEYRLRTKLEGKLNQALEQIRHLEQRLQAETEAKEAAETKSKASLNQTIEAGLTIKDLEESQRQAEQKLHRTLEESHKLELAKNAAETARYDLQQQFNRYQEITEHDKRLLEKTLQELQLEHSSILNRESELQNQVIGLEELVRQQSEQYQTLESKIIAYKEHFIKLEKIAENEKALRELESKKTKSALAAVEEMKLKLKEEHEKRNLSEKRAKKAVSYANSTIMQFLNVPINDPTQEKELDDKYLEELLK